MNYTAGQSFSIAVNRLLKQGCPSERNKHCYYRGPKGRKCAIGHLIDDEHYNHNLEQKKASDAGVSTAVFRSGHKEIAHIPSLLQSMQSIHDTVGADDWENAYDTLGKEYGFVRDKELL